MVKYEAGFLFSLFWFTFPCQKTKLCPFFPCIPAQLLCNRRFDPSVWLLPNIVLNEVSGNCSFMTQQKLLWVRSPRTTCPEKLCMYFLFIFNLLCWLQSTQVGEASLHHVLSIPLPLFSWSPESILFLYTFTLTSDKIWIRWIDMDILS